ncbi:ubiquinone anaerobic biosynthesis accessory factor UbiT [Kiloniella spongiae]|uniref:ubiquinone anaerobic biosynthesis accessory factor UbiT n=1 Tax=Kiloniella spongiae TaxID=1489064 RepID=UPI00069A6954|nr:SCP2 sterol-binding domain-containing protein [Kiloniella spongiae]
MHDKNALLKMPPFTPMLFAGFMMRPVPAFFLKPVAKRVLARMKKLYPEIFSRLAVLENTKFLITPTDLQYCFYLSVEEGQTYIDVGVNDAEHPEFQAAISGPMIDLLKLLEGRVDGDALFFSRALNIEGDTEAVLTLRNAVDSADVSLVDILGGPVPFMKPGFDKLFSKIGSFFEYLEQDFETVHRSILLPITRHMDEIDKELDKSEDRMKKMDKELVRIKASLRKKQQSNHKFVGGMQ